MAFPSISTVTPTEFSTAVTSMPVTMPASVSSGALLIAVVEIRNASSFTVPSGWSLLSSQAGGSSVGQLTAFYKIANGTEGGTTPTWQASVATSGIWQTVQITSWHGSTVPEVATSSGDFSTQPNPASLTPSWGAADTLWYVVTGNAATAALTTGAPTNYTGYDLDTTSSGGSQVNIASAYRELNASSEDPGEFANAGGIRYWAAMNIAIRPGAGSSAGVAARRLMFFGL